MSNHAALMLAARCSLWRLQKPDNRPDWQGLVVSALVGAGRRSQPDAGKSEPCTAGQDSYPGHSP